MATATCDAYGAGVRKVERGEWATCRVETYNIQENPKTDVDMGGPGARYVRELDEMRYALSMEDEIDLQSGLACAPRRRLTWRHGQRTSCSVHPLQLSTHHLSSEAIHFRLLAMLRPSAIDKPVMTPLNIRFLTVLMTTLSE